MHEAMKRSWKNNSKNKLKHYKKLSTVKSSVNGVTERTMNVAWNLLASVDTFSKILLNHLSPAYCSMFACVNRTFHDLIHDHQELSYRSQIPCAFMFVQCTSMRRYDQASSPSDRTGEFHQFTRPIAMEWLMGVVTEEALGTEVYYHAINIFDRFYETRTDLRTLFPHQVKVQLVILACLLVAFKLHGDCVGGIKTHFSAGRCHYHSAGRFSVKHIIDMERIVLQTLGYNLPAQYGYDMQKCLDHILSCSNGVRALASYLIQLSMLDPANIGTRPLQLLASAYSTALVMHNRFDFPLPCIADLCGCGVDETKQIAINMINLFERDLCNVCFSRVHTTFRIRYLKTCSITNSIVIRNLHVGGWVRNLDLTSLLFGRVKESQGPIFPLPNLQLLPLISHSSSPSWSDVFSG